MGLTMARAMRAIIPRYPHMGPQESIIWHKFLALTTLNFIKLEYDVAVGAGYVPEHYIEEWRKRRELYEKGLITYEQLREIEAVIESISYLTKLRIDVVGETKSEIWIFEVKPRAGRSALGQLESYHFWYVRQYRPTKPVRLAVVCYEVDKNLEPIFQERGIRVFTVPR